jgi:hypothetical protein
LALILKAVNEFDFPLRYSSTYIDSIGDTDEVRIFELDSGTLIAIIEENIEASGFKLQGDLFPFSKKHGIFNVRDGDNDLERGDGGM